MLDLYMDAAVAVEGELYFTTGNTRYLYKLSNKKITVETALPISESVVKKFASLVYYKSKIWMLPWGEADIWQYNIDTKKIKCFEMPQGIKPIKREAAFRRVVQVGKYIWTIPNYADCLFRIDMEKETYDRYCDWPKDVVIKKEQPNFKSISYENGKLYLFRDCCNKNLIVDIEDGSMQIWEIPCEKEFGIVKSEKAYIAPVHEKDKIRIYNIKGNRAELKKEITLPEEIWEGNEGYSFWHIDVIDDRVFMMPNKAKCILCINMETDTEKYIFIKDKDYMTKRMFKGFSGYETIKYKEKALLIPYIGNTLYSVNSDGEIEEKYPLKIGNINSEVETKAFINCETLISGEEWENKKISKAISERKHIATIGGRIFKWILQEN